MTRRKFEYLVFRWYPADHGSEFNLTVGLQEIGDKGWEMVSAVHDGDGCHHFYFKREVVRAPDV